MRFEWDENKAESNLAKHKLDFQKRKMAHKFEDLIEKEKISIQLDKDILGFFKKQGKGYQRKINCVLRAFVEGYGQH